MSVSVSVGMSCICVQPLQLDLDEMPPPLWPVLVPCGFSKSAVQLCSFERRVVAQLPPQLRLSSLKLPYSDRWDELRSCHLQP